MSTERKVTFLVGANIKNFQKNLDKASKKFKKFGAGIKNVGSTLSGAVTLPMTALGGVAIKTAAEFESLQTSLTTLTGSAMEGRKAFENLKQLSAGTPFQLQDLVKANNTLLGFSRSADEAFSDIQQIGDIAAVTGADIQSIAVAFGQSAAEGKLFSKDIRQLINNGVPAVKMLADTMGVAENQVFDLASQGKISFDILKRSFSEATSEGGMFANGMAKQSRTLSGLFSTLKDNINLAMGDLGESIAQALSLRTVIPALSENIGKIAQWFGSLSTETRSTMIKIVGAIGLVGPTLMGLGVAISTIGVALAALTSPVALVVGALAGLSAAILYISDNWKAITERISDIGWWRNTIIDMIQFMIDYNPFVKLIDGYNALARHFGIVEIPNPFKALSASLEHLKGETKDYKTEFGSFTDAVKNAISSVTGIDFGTFLNTSESEFDLAQRRMNEFGEGLGRVKDLGAGALKGLADATEGSLATVRTSIGKTTTFWQDFGTTMKEMSDQFKQFIAGELSSAVLSFGETLGQSLSGAENTWATTFEKITLVVLDFAKSLARLLAGIGGALMFVPGAQGQAAAMLAAAFGLQATVAGFEAGINKRISNREKRASATPALASGGIATGPTMAMVGDNYNAKVDPEVIAPLSKLKQYMGMGSGAMHVTVPVNIDGREIFTINKRVDMKVNR
jgi:tape measure domain-containing protein